MPLPLAFPMPGQLLAAAMGAPLVAFAAYRIRSLSKSGAFAASCVGFSLFGFGGGIGATALLLFFVSSSLLSRLGKKRKESLAFEKGGERDAGQVLANGGVAAVAAILLLIPGWETIGKTAVLGSLATANADTWATEIGTLYKYKPRRITDFQPAETGESGAISLPGSFAALLGALLIALVALFWKLNPASVFVVTIGGFVASLIDSLLGATLQAQYRCTVCGKLTERLSHHDQPTVPARGIVWMNNDMVNGLATLLGALIAVIGFLIFL